MNTEKLVGTSAAAIPRSIKQRPTPEGMRCVTAAFPTGVVLIAAELDGAPIGMLANSFTSVSLDPPLVSINVARSSSSWPLLRNVGRLGINVLAEHQEAEFRQLSQRAAADRFLGVNWSAEGENAVLLAGAAATFTVEIEHEVDAGDHVVVLLRVIDMHRSPEHLPLIFYSSRVHRFGAGADIHQKELP